MIVGLWNLGKAAQMAIQVRCDFTPGEFDIVRAALRELVVDLDQRIEDEADFSDEWRVLHAQRLLTQELAEKLRS